MTSTPHIVERLKACAHCDGPTHLRIEGDVTGCYHLGRPHCPIGRWTMTVEQWNHRTPDPKAATEIERLQSVITAYEAALRIVAERLSIEAQIACDPISEEARLRAKMGDCASTLFAALSSKGTQP